MAALLARTVWWRPSPRFAVRLAGAVVWVLAAVVVTGAVVRLTGSGLGCPTWPSCTATSVHSGTDVHGLIEFGNRVLSAVVFGVAVLALGYVVLRLGRRDTYRQVVGLAAGYAAEAVLGGISVLTRLNPLVVAAHFLLALGLLWLAIVIWRRLGHLPVAPQPAVGDELRWLTRALVAVAGLIVLVGTLVTGSGPYAGSRVDNRLPFDRAAITQLHSDLVLAEAGAVAVTLLLLRLSQAPDRLRRRGRVLLAVLAAQGAVGFAQYFGGLPAWLVGVHVAGATAFFAAALLLHLECWTRPELAAQAVTLDAELAQWGRNGATATAANSTVR